MGEVRRVASWRQMFAAAGADVVELAVTPDRHPHAGGVFEVVAGRAAPERLAWSGRGLRRALELACPDAVVVVSTRAFDARALEGPWTVVLDQVDSLARSYRDRAALVDGLPRRWGYRALAHLHGRIERNLHGSSMRRVAAGWSDARALGAEWVPNLVDPDLVPVPALGDVDVLFFGTLRYPPNIDALERMARLWPRLVAERPGTTALVAGSAPVPRVTELCVRHGWELVANFAALSTLAGRARVAAAPLSRVAGIQNKVLDAACVGLAQVVTPEALQGFAPGFPLKSCADEASFVTELIRLLEDPIGARTETDTVREYVVREYGAARWCAWAESLLS